MFLCLLRHGEAEPSGVLHAQDHLRPLSENGEVVIERIARNLQALVGGFPIILTSPFLRARETADIVAELCDSLSSPKIDETLNGRFEMEQIADRVAGLADYPVVLMIGHSPCFDQLAAYYITGDESTRIPFRPGTFAVLELPDPGTHTGLLRALVPPEVWSDHPPSAAPFLNL